MKRPKAVLVQPSDAIHLLCLALNLTLRSLNNLQEATSFPSRALDSLGKSLRLMAEC